MNEMETGSENRYDSERAELEAQNYQVVADDVPEERMAEFSDPKYTRLEKTSNPNTYTIFQAPEAENAEGAAPSEVDMQEETPDSARDETNKRIENILGPEMLAGMPSREEEEQKKAA